MYFKRGERILHPTKSDWGLGLVLEDSTDNKVRIFFINAGAKTISLSHLNLTKVQGDEANHPLLDNLKVPKEDNGVVYQSLPVSINNFLKFYPGGFYGEKYLRQEREYKVKAHELAVSLLNEKILLNLLKNEEYE